MLQACDVDLSPYAPTTLAALQQGDMAARHRPLAQLITALENDKVDAALRAQILDAAATPARADAGHHRHRRRRQVVADR